LDKKFLTGDIPISQWLGFGLFVGYDLFDDVLCDDSHWQRPRNSVYYAEKLSGVLEEWLGWSDQVIRFFDTLRCNGKNMSRYQ
jgi:hypothetical protein